MTTISIMPENSAAGARTYHAVAGPVHSVGKTPGEALDALTSQLPDEDAGTLVIVQRLRPDRYFTAEQQGRMNELMGRWRVARDAGTPLPSEEQAELETLVADELRAAAERAAEFVRQLRP